MSATLEEAQEAARLFVEASRSENHASDAYQQAFRRAYAALYAMGDFVEVDVAGQHLSLRSTLGQFQQEAIEVRFPHPST